MEVLGASIRQVELAETREFRFLLVQDCFLRDISGFEWAGGFIRWVRSAWREFEIAGMDGIHGMAWHG
jgi:hypothetical protein